MRALSFKKVAQAVHAAEPALTKMATNVFDERAEVAYIQLGASLVRTKPKKLTDEQMSAGLASCAHLVGLPPGEETLTLLRRNFWRLIANWYFIDEGMEIPEWRGEPETTDVAFLSVRKQRSTSPNSKPKYIVRVRLKTGLCAGIITGVLLSSQAIYHFLTKVSGTRAFNCAAEEIAGMEGRVVIEVVNNLYHIKTWTCNQAQKDINKKIAEARADVRKCKRGIPCNVCNMTVAQCPLAVWTEKEKVANNAS